MPIPGGWRRSSLQSAVVAVVVVVVVVVVAAVVGSGCSCWAPLYVVDAVLVK